MQYTTVIFVVCAIVLTVICNSLGAPVAAETSSLKTGSDAKSAFGQPFDEIVVESTLNVKRKPDGGRQSRTNQAATIRTKRQNGFPSFQKFNFPQFGGSSAAAIAQAQSYDVKSPLGKFGASASGGQSQSLAFGPNGPVSSAGFSGSQQYRLPNGQTFDVAFGNAAGNTGSNDAGAGTLAIHGPRV